MRLLNRYPRKHRGVSHAPLMILAPFTSLTRFIWLSVVGMIKNDQRRNHLSLVVCSICNLPEKCMGCQKPVGATICRPIRKCSVTWATNGHPYNKYRYIGHSAACDNSCIDGSFGRIASGGTPPNSNLSMRLLYHNQSKFNIKKQSRSRIGITHNKQRTLC